MEITSTNTSIYSSISTSQTASTTQNTSNSFNTLVNSQNQDTTTTTASTNKVYKKINDFLDAHNGYASLSPTDEKIFRDILSDNKLTKEEADSLSYEQVEKIAKLLTLSRCSGDEWKKTAPVVFSDVDLIATTKTSNRQFNEAYYNTMKELPDEQKGILESEVDNNLVQLYLGRELRATFQYEGSYLGNLWEFENRDADFGKFIKDVKSHHEAIIANHKADDEIKKQFQDIVDVYNVLEKNYNQVLSKTKYA